MDRSLQGIALVTGATSGFGRATAARLAGMGARVIACGRRQERLDALAAELGDRVLPVVLDVRDRAAVAAALAALPRRLVQGRRAGEQRRAGAGDGARRPRPTSTTGRR